LHEVARVFRADAYPQKGTALIMSQRLPRKTSPGDRPITWREASVYAHGALTTASLHHQLAWPMASAAAVGMTGPMLWALLRRR
jgi:hypothetical protein